MALEGTVQLESDAFGLIDSYIPQIDRASGHVSANLKMSGSLMAPQFDGELDVRQGQLDAYAVDFALRDLNFAAKLSGNQLQLAGTATAGVEGKARFDGQLAWRDGQPFGKLHLEGRICAS